jgi:hypothetical protein
MRVGGTNQLLALLVVQAVKCYHQHKRTKQDLFAEYSILAWIFPWYSAS